jgi:hypothetical protein
MKKMAAKKTKKGYKCYVQKSGWGQVRKQSGIRIKRKKAGILIIDSVGQRSTNLKNERTNNK